MENQTSNGTAKKRESSSLRLDPPRVQATITINKSISMMRGMVFFSWIFTAFVIAAALFFVYNSHEAAQDRVFVATNLGTLYGVNAKYVDIESRKIEVDNHIRSFIGYMFSFDEGDYKDHLERGYELIGTDGDKIVKEYNESDMYQKLRSQNMKVTCSVDSIHINMDKNPYTAEVLFRQTYTTSTSELNYINLAKMTLRNVARINEKNPTGLKIENWEITNSQPIK